MQQLRDLAHDGRTVVVVTHSMANLDTCDRLLVLAPGGKMAFYNLSAQELLQIMVTCACLAGMASAVRELVKEHPIYIRERAAGLSPGAYLISKLLVLGVISIGQSAVLVLIGVSWRPKIGRAHV